MTEPTAYEMHRHCNRAATKADRLQHQAALLRSSDGDSKADARADTLLDDANAIRALVRFYDRERPKLPPELESQQGAIEAVSDPGGRRTP